MQAQVFRERFKRRERPARTNSRLAQEAASNHRYFELADNTHLSILRVCVNILVIDYRRPDVCRYGRLKAHTCRCLFNMCGLEPLAVSLPLRV